MNCGILNGRPSSVVCVCVCACVCVCVCVCVCECERCSYSKQGDDALYLCMCISVHACTHSMVLQYQRVAKFY